MNALDSLTIHQFRGLHEVSLTGLGRINLLVGANNSGKTSVLETIATYCHPLDALEWLQTAGRREIGSSSLPRLDALKWLFPQTGTSEPGSYQGETRVAGTGRHGFHESHATFEENEGTSEDKETELADTETRPTEVELAEDPNPAVVDPAQLVHLFKLWRARKKAAGFRGTRRGAQLSLALTPEKNGSKKLDRSFQLWEDEPVIRRRRGLNPLLPAATITPFAHRVEELQIQQLSDATMEGFKDTVLDVLRRIDPQVQDLEILAPQGTRSPTGDVFGGPSSPTETSQGRGTHADFYSCRAFLSPGYGWAKTMVQ
jgi:hypothetical protein